MMEKMKEEITPFRINLLMKTASKITDLMVNGVYRLQYEEMEIVLNIVQSAMHEAMEKNAGFRSEREEVKDVSEHNEV